MPAYTTFAPMLPLALTESHGETMLNVAAVLVGTTVLGPGWRTAVWVQGCPFHCRGCIAPDWTAMKTASAFTVEDLARVALSDERIDGLTLSGGEPMLQAIALAEFVAAVRRQREINVICYSGYKRELLQSESAPAGAQALLDQVDVLIDGLYVETLNDNRGLRGSSNQRIHHITGKLAHFNFETAPRQVEIQIRSGYALAAGLPPRSFSNVLNDAIRSASKYFPAGGST